MKKIIETDKAPKAIGPYAQAVQVGNFVFTSGQIPLNPETLAVVGGDIAAQTAQVLNNLQQVLLAAGASLQAVVKTTVFLQDMNDFSAMNQVYETRFSPNTPARSTVQVARLPKDVLIEIECIAVIS